MLLADAFFVAPTPAATIANATTADAQSARMTRLFIPNPPESGGGHAIAQLR
jgi:hypothetical protein